MKQLLSQHNAITEARYEMSALEKNIVYMLMHELKENDPPEKEYVVDIAKLEGVMGEIRIKELQKATENLVRRTYHIKESNGDVLIVSLMTVVTHDGAAKKLYIKISQRILPYFIGLRKDFTQFQLQVALSLKSKYSKRIYEMLSQHKEQGIMRISVKELKYRLALLDPKTGKEQYTSWAMFKAHVLERPRKDLAEYTELSFTYNAVKSGRRYTDLTFQIYQNKSQNNGFQSTLNFAAAL